MDNFYQFFDKYVEPNVKTNKYQFGDNHENALKIISGKKSKVVEYKNLQKMKNDLYWKLSEKLEQQLKQIKNHNTPQARQKLYLLQKCRNQKHIRRKTAVFIRQSQNKFQQSQKHSLYRPKTGCSRKIKNSNSGIDVQKSKSNRASLMKQKQNVNLDFLHDKFQTIKYRCFVQKKRSQQIKQGLDTALFYQKLVSKNSSLIFNKIL